MNSEILLLKSKAETLLKQYRSFTYGLSADNPFSRFSFMDKQPQFEAQARALNAAYRSINSFGLSFEDFRQYEELSEVMSELNDEIF